MQLKTTEYKNHDPLERRLDIIQGKLTKGLKFVERKKASENVIDYHVADNKGKKAVINLTKANNVMGFSNGGDPVTFAPIMVTERNGEKKNQYMQAFRKACNLAGLKVTVPSVLSSDHTAAIDIKTAAASKKK